MWYDKLNNADLLTTGAVFGLVLVLWMMLLLVWSIRRAMRVRKVERRLGLSDFNDEAEAGGATRVLRLWRDDQEATTRVPLLRKRAGLWQRLSQYGKDAGFEAPLATLLAGAFGLALLAFVLTYLITRTFMPPFAATGVVIFVLITYANLRKSRQIGSFERQFTDALGLISRSLRAGHPLLAAFRLGADQLPRPARDVFIEICQQQALGVSLEDALRRVGAKYSSPDLKLFAASVIIQLRSGGNLAELMDRLAQVIRDRMRLGRRVRILTAQTQLSKRILIALPFVVFVIINILNPKYMQPLYTTQLGQLMLLLGGLSLVMGMWVMKRLAVLKY